jgi:hypothetical protein
VPYYHWVPISSASYRSRGRRYVCRTRVPLVLGAMGSCAGPCTQTTSQASARCSHVVDIAQARDPELHQRSLGEAGANHRQARVAHEDPADHRESLAAFTSTPNAWAAGGAESTGLAVEDFGTVGHRSRVLRGQSFLLQQLGQVVLDPVLGGRQARRAVDDNRGPSLLQLTELLVWRDVVHVHQDVRARYGVSDLGREVGHVAPVHV